MEHTTIKLKSGRVVTEEHIGNLKLLMTGLRKMIEDDRPLRMFEFVSGNYRDEHTAVRATPEHPCNTPACVIGNGPSFGIPLKNRHFHPVKKSFDGHPSVLWHCYTSDSFGLIPADDEFQFMFGPDWSDSRSQALSRIMMFLDNGLPVYWRFTDKYDTEYDE